MLKKNSDNTQETIKIQEPFQEMREKYNCLKNKKFHPKLVKIPKKFKGMRNMTGFSSRYKMHTQSNIRAKDSIHRKQINPEAIKEYDFLSKMREQVTDGLDPIRYLYNLYYNIQISTTDISNEYRLLWDSSTYHSWKWDTRDKYNIRDTEHKTTYDFISRLFKNFFKWELREMNERTPLRDEKDRTKNPELKTEAKNEKIETIQKIEKILNRISRDKTKHEYSAEEYSKLKFAMPQTKYILDINGYINEDDFEDTLIKLSNKYGMKVTAVAVNNILRKETEKIGNMKEIKLNPGRLSEIKKKGK